MEAAISGASSASALAARLERAAAELELALKVPLAPLDDHRPREADCSPASALSYETANPLHRWAQHCAALGESLDHVVHKINEAREEQMHWARSFQVKVHQHKEDLAKVSREFSDCATDAGSRGAAVRAAIAPTMCNKSRIGMSPLDLRTGSCSISPVDSREAFEATQTSSPSMSPCAANVDSTAQGGNLWRSTGSGGGLAVASVGSSPPAVPPRYTAATALLSNPFTSCPVALKIPHRRVTTPTVVRSVSPFQGAARAPRVVTPTVVPLNQAQRQAPRAVWSHEGPASVSQGSAAIPIVLPTRHFSGSVPTVVSPLLPAKSAQYVAAVAPPVRKEIYIPTASAACTPPEDPRVAANAVPWQRPPPLLRGVAATFAFKA